MVNLHECFLYEVPCGCGSNVRMIEMVANSTKKVTIKVMYPPLMVKQRSQSVSLKTMFNLCMFLKTVVLTNVSSSLNNTWTDDTF